MGLETTAINSIIDNFKTNQKTPPPVWFEYGTLWADTNSKLDVNIIKQGLEKVINPKCKIQISKLKATETEPWDQYAFDITAPEGI
jgi:hypothetical protein